MFQQFLTTFQKVEQPSEEVTCPAMQVDATDAILASLRQIANNDLSEHCIRLVLYILICFFLK